MSPNHQPSDAPYDRDDNDVAALTVVYHPVRELIGASVVLVPGEERRFGRAAPGGLPGVFQGDRASREHARVVLSERGAVIEDLGSRNGTYLDGARIRRADLFPGAILGLGDALLRYDLGPRPLGPSSDPDLPGLGRAVHDLVADVAQIGPREAPVVLAGEVGTGKGLVARALHRRSGRSGPIIGFSCDAPEVRLAELAANAAGGTLVVAELERASPALQAALRGLLGKNLRLIFACSTDLDERARAGNFDAALWAGVSRWLIDVPPLRDRADDLPLLALGFIRRAAGGDGGLSPELALALMGYAWPGNLPELAAVIDAAVEDAGGAWPLGLSPALARRLAGPGTCRAPRPVTTPGPGRPLRRPDREALVATLEHHAGDVRAVATALGVRRRTLYRWLDAHAIDLDTANQLTNYP